jgi:hypothetical protein
LLGWKDPLPTGQETATLLGWKDLPVDEEAATLLGWEDLQAE